MSAKVVQVLNKCLVQPVCKVGNVIENTAIKRNNLKTGEFAEDMARHNAAGTDFAALQTRKMFEYQRMLFFYRVERAFIEGRSFCSGAYCKDYNYKNFVVDLRFATRALAVYIIGCFIGRWSVYPLISPESPYAIGLEYKRNPNF